MKKHEIAYQDRHDIELFQGDLSSHTYSWHFHETYTFIFVQKGVVTYTFKNIEISVGEQKVLVINPYEVHFNKIVSDCSYSAIFLPIRYLQPLPVGTSLLTFQEKIYTSKELYDKLKNAFVLLEKTNTPHKINLIVNDLAKYLLNNLKHKTQEKSIDNRLLRVIEFIDENISDKLSLEKLSALSFLSKFHFQRLFKKQIGLSVHNYIQLRRTELAKQLLKSKKNIVPIALDAGYYDQSHFYKAFKKMWVVNPSYFFKK